MKYFRFSADFVVKGKTEKEAQDAFDEMLGDWMYELTNARNQFREEISEHKASEYGIELGDE